MQQERLMYLGAAFSTHCTMFSGCFLSPARNKRIRFGRRIISPRMIGRNVGTISPMSTDNLTHGDGMEGVD